MVSIHTWDSVIDELSLSGVPFGLAIIHKSSKERELVKFGSAIEHLIGGRPRPKFLHADAVGYLYTGTDLDSNKKVG